MVYYRLIKEQKGLKLSMMRIHTRTTAAGAALLAALSPLALASGCGDRAEAPDSVASSPAAASTPPADVQIGPPGQPR